MRRLRPDHPIDLRRSLSGVRAGGLDPTVRLGDGQATLALRTPAGAATLDLAASVGTGEIVATAWGPGAGWALDQAPAIAGCDDHARDFVPADRRIAAAWRRLPGLRMVRTGLVTAALLSVVPGQRVTSEDAARSFRGLVRRWGEPAPGPAELWLQPDPAVLATLPYHELHPIGLERRRAEIVRRVAASASVLEALAGADLPGDEARRRMERIVGIGPWSAGLAASIALGDPDAVPVGDLHLKHAVCRALAGERWGTDERMLDLLAPFAGHRGRVCRLVLAAGLGGDRSRPRRL
jgi:3-methyladenine DNA glycosylase/8-oxoguanine DNA glycosylase